MDFLLSLLAGGALSFLKYYFTTSPSRVSEYGYLMGVELDLALITGDLALKDCPLVLIKEHVFMNYPLIHGTCKYTVQIPQIYAYDEEWVYMLSVLFSSDEPTNMLVLRYFCILLSWCVAGSHFLCTQEGMDMLILTSRLVFGEPAIGYTLEWSHEYLLLMYGNDYHLVVPTFDENKMAYLAYNFIQILELPYY